MRPTTGALGGAALGVVALVLAGCATVNTMTTGAGPGSVAAGQPGGAGGGTVRGTFEMAGGAVQPGKNSAPDRPLSGVVMFRAGSGRTTDITTGPAGQFAGYLPSGTYTVTARTEQIRQQNADGSLSDPPCAIPVTVVVRPGQVTTVALVCPVP